MKTTRALLAMTAALALSACASVETATRNAPVQAPALAAPTTLPTDLAANTLAEPYAVSQFNVRVPRTLHVSERNSFKPVADIVWREDPLGDRYVQVGALIKDGLQPLTKTLTEGRNVVVDIQITRFHALTQKTRYTVGGTHDIHFFMTVLDGQTGEVLQPARHIETELKALGGSAALEAMSRGETQKVRIQRHLRQVITQELKVNTVPQAPGTMQLSALSSRGI